MATNKHYLVQSFEPSQTITNEVHTVLDGKFLLDYIPDQLIRISITGYTQIPWNNAITSATQFKVNYQNGEVQVHSSKEGVSITVTSYGAKGIIKYYADRIVLDNGETIQNKVSSLSSVIESIETADSNAQIGVYPLIASGTNTYTTSYTGLTYYDGLKISLTISAIQKNTGASTLNINSLGDKYIKYYDGNGNKQSLTGGELVGKVLLEYDGSEFLIVSNNAYLNAIKSELDAHKAESATKAEVALKADKTYVDTLTASIASGSPKGVYATLAALTAAIPAGDDNIYVVTEDGKWYYWDVSAWTAGGVYQSTGLSDNGVTSTKVSALAYGKPFIMPGLTLPNYDTATQTLSFNSDATYKCMLFYKNTKYDIPVGTTVVDANSTTAVQLIFDVTSSTFSFIPHSTVLNENQLRVAVYKRYSGVSGRFYEWDFPCNLTVDGGLVGSNRGIGVINGTAAVNVNFTTNKMTFPTGSFIILCNNKSYTVAGGTIVDIALPDGYFSGVIYYNTATGDFITRNSGTLASSPDSEIIVGVIYPLYDKAYIYGNYTINSKIPNYSEILNIINGEIPSYYQTEIDDTVSKVETNSLNKSLVFTVLTDSHYDGVNYFSDTAKNIKAVNKVIKSNAIIHLGDIVNGDLVYASTKSILNDAYSKLRESNLPVFALMGNHDDNSYHASKAITNLVTQDRWYGISQRQEEFNVVREGNAPYYYVDYPRLKIRAVYLNAIDYTLTDDGAGNAVNFGANYWGYGQDQLVWLGETALSTENGYGVLVFSHMPTRAELNYNSADNIQRGAVVEGILQAYTTKSSYVYTEASRTLDYSSKTGVEVIAFFYGHTHGDSAKTVSGCSFPFISIACSHPSQIASQYLPADSVAPTRTWGTASYECWDVMTLRPDERKIYMTRFGAGDDRVIDY